MEKINYIISSWFGERRFVDDKYEKDRNFYMNFQLNYLEKLKHNLSQITFVINKSENDNDGSFLDTIKSINGVKLEVLRRENIGMSMGAWSYAYDQFPDFDYYFFIEDDYVPTIDYFDQIAVEQIKKYPKCGFLVFAEIVMVNKSTMFSELNNLPETYFVPIYQANGLMKKECCEFLRNKHGKIPYFSSSKYEEADAGILFHAINENFTINKLEGYSSVALCHSGINPSVKRNNYNYITYGNGLLFISAIQNI